jgi:hypothetical protein
MTVEDLGPFGSETQRACALETMLDDFAREAGQLTAEARIVLRRLVEDHAEAVALWRLEQQGMAPVE